MGKNQDVVSVKERCVNSINTNFNNLIRSTVRDLSGEKSKSMYNMTKRDNKRNDALFVHYCIGELNLLFGQSRRHIMCRLLMKGLEADPEYGGVLEQLRRDYDQEKYIEFVKANNNL